LINEYTNDSLYTGTFFYHQYFSFLTLLMFNSIDFSLPQALGFAPTLPPYIENPATVHVCLDLSISMPITSSNLDQIKISL